MQQLVEQGKADDLYNAGARREQRELDGAPGFPVGGKKFLDSIRVGISFLLYDSKSIILIPDKK